MTKNYSLNEIRKSLKKLNIKKKDVVYVSGNLVSFGKPKINNLSDLPKIFIMKFSD